MNNIFQNAYYKNIKHKGGQQRKFGMKVKFTNELEAEYILTINEDGSVDTSLYVEGDFNDQFQPEGQQINEFVASNNIKIDKEQLKQKIKDNISITDISNHVKNELKSIVNKISLSKKSKLREIYKKYTNEDMNINELYELYQYFKDRKKDKYIGQCWDSIHNGKYNIKNEESYKRCNILYYIYNVIGKQIYIILNRLVLNITNIIDNSFKNNINAGKLARTKYYIIKNSSLILYEIFKKLADKKYENLYDNLKYQPQYMQLLQITKTKNFKLSNNEKKINSTILKINSTILKIREYTFENLDDIKFLCNFLEIEYNNTKYKYILLCNQILDMYLKGKSMTKDEIMNNINYGFNYDEKKKGKQLGAGKYGTVFKYGQKYVLKKVPNNTIKKDLEIVIKRRENIRNKHKGIVEKSNVINVEYSSSIREALKMIFMKYISIINNDTDFIIPNIYYVTENFYIMDKINGKTLVKYLLPNYKLYSNNNSEITKKKVDKQKVDKKTLDDIQKKIKNLNCSFKEKIIESYTNIIIDRSEYAVNAFNTLYSSLESVVRESIIKNFNEKYGNITYKEHTFKFNHADIHWENIMVDQHNKLNIIDPNQAFGVLLNEKKIPQN